MDDLLQMPHEDMINYKHDALHVDPRNNLIWKNKEFVVGKVEKDDMVELFDEHHNDIDVYINKK